MGVGSRRRRPAEAFVLGVGLMEIRGGRRRLVEAGGGLHRHGVELHHVRSNRMCGAELLRLQGHRQPVIRSDSASRRHASGSAASPKIRIVVGICSPKCKFYIVYRFAHIFWIQQRKLQTPASTRRTSCAGS